MAKLICPVAGIVREIHALIFITNAWKVVNFQRSVRPVRRKEQ